MIILQIEGMTCAHCQRAVEGAIRGVAGVTSVEVSLADKLAKVQGTAQPAELIAAVVEEGYQAQQK